MVIGQHHPNDYIWLCDSHSILAIFDIWVVRFIMWWIPKLINCVFTIRFAKWIFFWYRSNPTIRSAQLLINDVKKTSFTYNTENNVWKPLSPVCIRKLGILPSDCPVSATAFGSGRHSVHIIGRDNPQFIILKCVAITVRYQHLQNCPLLYWLDYCWLIDAANSQPMMLCHRAWYCFCTTIGAVSSLALYNQASIEKYVLQFCRLIRVSKWASTS